MKKHYTEDSRLTQHFDALSGAIFENGNRGNKRWDMGNLSFSSYVSPNEEQECYIIFNKVEKWEAHLDVVQGKFQEYEIITLYEISRMEFMKFCKMIYKQYGVRFQDYAKQNS